MGYSEWKVTLEGEVEIVVGAETEGEAIQEAIHKVGDLGVFSLVTARISRSGNR